MASGLAASWARLGGLAFVARKAVDGLWAGTHPSIRRGPGLEFHDYRPYVPGDDVGEVDWKLFARTDRPYVRRHRQLTDLRLYLLVDCSASMDFAPVSARGVVPEATALDKSGMIQPHKFAFSSALAAAVAFLTIRQRDRAGLGLFADGIQDHQPPSSAWPELMHLCRMLEDAAPSGPGRIGKSLIQAHAMIPRRGLLVLISDLLDEPAELFDGLDRFRHDRCEVIVFQVLTRQELNLDGLRRVQARMRDAETLQTLRTDLGRIQSSYTQVLQEHIQTIQRGCTTRGIDYELLTTDQSVMQALRHYLARRNHLAR